MTTKLNKDMISGIGLIVFSILLLWKFIHIGVQLPNGDHLAVLAPDFWIKIIVWTLLVLGMILLWEGIQQARQQPSDTAEDELTESEYRNFPQSVYLVALVIGLLFVYYQGITYFGMMLSSMIALVVFIRISGENRWKIIIPLALFQPVLLHYFFLKVAGIPMPLGIFE